MSYFEKRAALHVQINDIVSARGDLEAANTLAAALNDADTQKRILNLLASLPEQQAPAPVPAPNMAQEPAPAPVQPAPEVTQ
jgi:hypothetical protein